MIFVFNDIDIGDTLYAIYITVLPNKGDLILNGSGVTLNQEILSVDIVNLSFTPERDISEVGYATFDFYVNDGELNSTQAYTATINVNLLDTDDDGIPRYRR
ncbi:MAG: hypothetical protein Q9M36_03940 [Sulfurovum sp.]|nr:hypothetical protein [Sulfurovum sp.]